MAYDKKSPNSFVTVFKKLQIIFTCPSVTKINFYFHFYMNILLTEGKPS